MMLRVAFFLSLLAWSSQGIAELSKEMEKRILSKIPQIDKNGDKKISKEELKEGISYFPERMKPRIEAFINGRSGSAMNRASIEGRAQEVLERLGLKGEQNIVYKSSTTNETTLDIIYPKEKKYEKSPLFILIHGGGYVGGSKSKIYSHTYIIESLSNAGITIASIDYRLAGKREPIMMNQINQDCKDALRFLAKNAEAYGIDPHKFITWGTSAGGSLALITAMTEDEFLPGDVMGEGIDHTVIGSVVYFGATSFVDESVWEKRKQPMKGFLFQENHDLSEDEIRKLTSPDLHLQSDCPPLLLFYGDKDYVVPVDNGRHLNKLAKSLNIDVTYHEIKNAGHGFKSVDGQASMTNADIEKIMVEHVLKWVNY